MAPFGLWIGVLRVRDLSSLITTNVILGTATAVILLAGVALFVWEYLPHGHSRRFHWRH